MRKHGITGYVRIGLDWIRASVATLDSGDVVLVREDGSNAVLPEMGGVWRTSGDVTHVAARQGKAFNMSALASADLPAHEQARKGRKASQTFKAERTIRQFARHMLDNNQAADALVAGLLISYESEQVLEQIAA